MGSKPSKEKHTSPVKSKVVIPAKIKEAIPSKTETVIPTRTETIIPVKTKTVVLPRIPQEIIDEILDHLAADSDLRSLRSCVLVSRSWVPSCRQHLFRAILFNSEAAK